MYFTICPLCGAHLDPGERYKCMKKDASSVETTQSVLRKEIRTNTRITDDIPDVNVKSDLIGRTII